MWSPLTLTLTSVCLLNLRLDFSLLTLASRRIEPQSLAQPHQAGKQTHGTRSWLERHRSLTWPELRGLALPHYKTLEITNLSTELFRGGYLQILTHKTHLWSPLNVYFLSFWWTLLTCNIATFVFFCVFLSQTLWIMQRLWMVFVLAGTLRATVLQDEVTRSEEHCSGLLMDVFTHELSRASRPLTHCGPRSLADVIFPRQALPPPPPTLRHFIDGCSSAHLMTPQMKFRKILPSRR